MRLHMCVNKEPPSGVVRKLERYREDEHGSCTRLTRQNRERYPYYFQSRSSDLLHLNDTDKEMAREAEIKKEGEREREDRKGQKMNEDGDFSKTNANQGYIHEKTFQKENKHTYARTQAHAHTNAHTR